MYVVTVCMYVCMLSDPRTSAKYDAQMAGRTLDAEDYALSRHVIGYTVEEPSFLDVKNINPDDVA